MKKLLKNVWFWVIVICALFLFSCVSCFSCDSGCSCNNGEKLDLTQDFSQDQIDSWKKQNKQKENEYVLNGGYYINYKGVNYPVVFTSGKITQFDNMPEDLFFLEMFELFTDQKLKNCCAFRGSYTKFYSFFKEAEDWDGYVLYGKRPKLGTVLYVDENDGRRFLLDDSLIIDRERVFGPDDPIPQLKKLSDNYIYCVQSADKILPIAYKGGILFSECNTVRKLYYWAKQNNMPFYKTVEYSNIPIPEFFYAYSWNKYSYSNDWTDGDTFNEKALQEAKSESRTTLLFKRTESTSNLIFNVNYNSNEYSSKTYNVFLGENGSSDLNYKIKNGYYTDVVKNDEGQVESYVYDGTRYYPFIGSLDQFDEFLKKDVIDKTTKKSIAYFKSENATSDFKEQFLILNNKIYSKESTFNIYAVWDDCKSLTMHGEEINSVLICKGQEYNLPLLKKPGYTFVGWFSSSDYSGAVITTVAYTDAFSDVYAKFEKVDHYTLTFEPYNGQTFENIVYSYGDEVQLPVLTKSFYVFEGWCTDEQCLTQPQTGISAKFYGDYHMYPCFTPRKYNVTLVCEGSTQIVQLAYGENYTLPIEQSEDQDKKFIGYYDIDGVRYTDENGKSLKPFTDGAVIQLFARYKEEE